MQRSHTLKSAVFGLGLCGLIASSASANIILYNSNSFEQSAGYVAGTTLTGQPASKPATERWAGINTVGAGGVTAPVAGVFAYNPSNPAAGQYALVQATNNFAGSSGFFYPKHNLAVADGGTGPYTYTGAPNTNTAVAVTFNMTVVGAASGSTAANDEFFGIVGYGSTGEIGGLGLNNRTGAYVLPANATVFNASPFGAGVTNLNQNRGYELLLDYSTQTWSIYSQLVSGVTPFILDAVGPFTNASTTFTDADLVAYNLGNGVSNGNAIFDDYLVQSIGPQIPEPASMVVGLATFGLLAARRRRIV